LPPDTTGELRLFDRNAVMIPSKIFYRVLPAWKREAVIVLVNVALFALMGCSTIQPSEQTPTIVQQHAGNGYIVKKPHDTTVVHQTWQIGTDAVDITLTMPTGSGLYPLVIYLPGLGESSNAGVQWRRGWAEAGYAVLSAQPVTTGEKVWSSEAAQAGEFRAIAKEHFSTRSLADRLIVLRGVLDELRRQQENKNTALFNHFDLSRLAIAGYDLGAQTAMAVAGEHSDGIELPPFPDAVKCVIALSPYADPSGTDIESRFSSIRIPVLSVTSNNDTDPYGWVTSAAVRQTPYQYMPPKQKYLLLLSTGSHFLLAGREVPAAGQQDDKATRTTRAPDTNEGDDNGGARHRGGGSGRKGRKGREGGNMAETGTLMLQQGLSVFERLEITDIQQVSTAFLDAAVKNDPLAREWLSKDVQGWLADMATISTK
jgi:predicted dienelactone hydrolase